MHHHIYVLVTHMKQTGKKRITVFFSPVLTELQGQQSGDHVAFPAESEWLVYDRQPCLEHAAIWALLGQVLDESSPASDSSHVLALLPLLPGAGLHSDIATAAASKMVAHI